MIMKCPVILNNSAVTVFDFNGEKVQVASINRSAKYVNVLFENGRYTIVADNYTEIKSAEEDRSGHNSTNTDFSNETKFNHRRVKKTTIDSTSEDNNVESVHED